MTDTGGYETTEIRQRAQEALQRLGRPDPRSKEGTREVEATTTGTTEYETAVKALTEAIKREWWEGDHMAPCWHNARPYVDALAAAGYVIVRKPSIDPEQTRRERLSRAERE